MKGIHALQPEPHAPRILIAEDERITAQHLRQSLTRFGYEVIGVTSSGPATIEEAAQKLPDLLLADIGLKGHLDGITAATQIREQWHIPTIFLTAYADSETIKRAQLAEPYGYLIKPFDEDELHATIEIALKQSSVLAARDEQTRLNLNTIERTQEELNRVARKLVCAQEDERQRLARDLHDDIGQQLALISMKLATMADKLPADEAKSECQEIMSAVNAVSDDVRKLSHNLHPSAIEHLGLKAALKALAEDFGETQSIPTRFSARDMPASLTHEVQLALYRIVQEALRNVAKHAAARSVDIALVGGANEIYLSIRDSGKGFPVEKARTEPGLGLINMAQRALLIGADLDLTSTPNAGTQISIRVPLQDATVKIGP
jgi:signal transduction histidine kinase